MREKGARRRALVVKGLVLVALAGCNPKPLEERVKVDAGDVPGGLTVEESRRVLAKVGDRTITLGDFAAALERMNEFDRLRYQTPEKRRELLDEMIDLELLAVEAKRRGLDKSPEAEESVRQVLRDAMLAEARKGLPPPAEIPPAEVRAYYDAHRAEYREPERRRVSAIVFKDRKEAEKVLPDAKKASPMEWGKLVQKYADPPVKPGPGQPLETLGDLGIVGPPGDPKGDHVRVPAEIRAAAFEIPGEVGAVLDRVVSADGKHFVIKIAGKSPPHERSFPEAERSIRGILLQQKMEARTKELEDSLRKQFPVTIDEGVLAQVSVPSLPPSPFPSATPPSDASAAPAPSGPAKP
jgi:peptidyl-prolyl cis-trans isomerase C